MILDERVVEHQLALLADSAVDAVVGRVLTPGIDRLRLPYPPPQASAAKRAFCFGQYRDDVRVERISYCAAGHFCVRRRVLAEIGGWDEHILTYGDKDMGLRMYAAGKNVVYDPHPTLTHLAVATGGTRLTDPRPLAGVAAGGLHPLRGAAALARRRLLAVRHGARGPAHLPVAQKRLATLAMAYRTLGLRQGTGGGVVLVAQRGPFVVSRVNCP